MRIAQRPTRDHGREAAALQRREEREFRQAVANERLILHVQGIYQIDGGGLAAAEALLRWPHSQRGQLSPTTFLPLADRLGLLAPIGQWVLSKACAIATGFAQPIAIGVNVSAVQLAAPMLLRQVGAALALAGLPADRLRLELPESALMELDEDAWLMLAALRDVGIELWLDNFGAGQISLGVLRRLPLTGVKLDLSLVRELPDNAETCRFAATLVDVSLLHGLRVCALGVETPAQQEFLAGLGCQEAQGQLLAPPVPAAEFRTDRRSKPRDTGAALWRRAAVPAGG